jgi:hypothetical protein
MRTIVLVISAIIFSSCMHMGMMGTSNGHGSMSTGQMKTESVLEKEVLAGDIKVTATFPPLVLDGEVVLEVRMVDTKIGQPIRGAKVMLHVQRSNMEDAQAVHDHTGKITDQNPESIQEEMTDQPFEESREAGVYSIPLRSKQSGEYKLIVHVVEIPGRKLESGIVIEAKRMVQPKMEDHSSGMMGMGDTTTTIVVGTMVMGAMMVVMLVAR